MGPQPMQPSLTPWRKKSNPAFRWSALSCGYRSGKKNKPSYEKIINTING